VEVILAPLKRISGFALASLVDADSGTIIGAVRNDDSMSVPVASAGAADVFGVLSLMTSRLALPGDLEDVIVTLASHYHLIQALPPSPTGQLILLVTLNRPSVNLAMARREVREAAKAVAGLWLSEQPRLNASPA
jgi:predicted regulator of Ras-like GTPase activity (Roadblock/LC7/MglB family)